MNEHLNIGFISTRFAGTDGVSLETAKWAEVLKKMGHECRYFSGLCDRPKEISMVVEDAFYKTTEIKVFHDAFFSKKIRTEEETQWILDKKNLSKNRNKKIC